MAIDREFSEYLKPANNYSCLKIQPLLSSPARKSPELDKVQLFFFNSPIRRSPPSPRENTRPLKAGQVFTLTLRRPPCPGMSVRLGFWSPPHRRGEGRDSPPPPPPPNPTGAAAENPSSGTRATVKLNEQGGLKSVVTSRRSSPASAWL